MVRVWNRGRCAMNGWSHDGGNWLWDGTGDKAKQPLAAKKRLKLTFPKEEVLLIELYDNGMDNI